MNKKPLEIPISQFEVEEAITAMMNLTYLPSIFMQPKRRLQPSIPLF
jgi:hypothetical protein